MPLCRSGGQRVKVMLLRGLLRILIDMLIVLWRSSRVKTIASNVQRSQTLLPSSEKKRIEKTCTVLIHCEVGGDEILFLIFVP